MLMYNSIFPVYFYCQLTICNEKGFESLRNRILYMESSIWTLSERVGRTFYPPGSISVKTKALHWRSKVSIQDFLWALGVDQCMALWSWWPQCSWVLGHLSQGSVHLFTWIFLALRYSKHGGTHWSCRQKPITQGVKCYNRWMHRCYSSPSA